MEKELLNSDKELLLRDLSGRLPYGVKVKTNNIHILKLGTHTRVGEYVTDVIEPCKPYLFPLSSMAEEQKEFLRRQSWCIAISTSGTIETTIEGFDWLNKNHFDYRGLIEKSLALDATNLGIYE